MASGAREVTWTRRGFIGAALGAAVGVRPALAAAARIGRADPATAASPLAPAAFVSRPDLVPPLIAVTSEAAGTSAGFIFLAPFPITAAGTNAPHPHSGPLIVDDGGNPVWFKPISKQTGMNFRVQRYRGRPVLTWYEGDVLGGYGGELVIADSSYREILRFGTPGGVHADLHEFLITSRNTALVSIYSNRPADLSSVGGPASGVVVDGIVQELELPSRKVLLEWRSYDHVGLDESFFPEVTTAGNVDYFHLNSIGVDGDGNLLVSARNTSTVYKVHRKSGKVLWRLGGKQSDFAFASDATFHYQHDVRRHNDGTLTIFDNETSSPQEAAAGPSSRAIRLALDMKAMQASLVGEYKPPDRQAAWAMGNVQQLPDGGVFVDWGTAGSFTEFAADGSVRLDASFGDGSVSYRGFRFPWVGLPTGRPAVVLAQNPDRTMTAHVSWNGATEVRRWRVLAGQTKATLRPVRTVARQGFETAITFPAPKGYLAVAALGANGRTLGSTKLIKV